MRVYICVCVLVYVCIGVCLLYQCIIKIQSPGGGFFVLHFHFHFVVI